MGQYLPAALCNILFLSLGLVTKAICTIYEENSTLGLNAKSQKFNGVCEPWLRTGRTALKVQCFRGKGNWELDLSPRSPQTSGNFENRKTNMEEIGIVVQNQVKILRIIMTFFSLHLIVTSRVKFYLCPFFTVRFKATIVIFRAIIKVLICPRYIFFAMS